MEAVLRLKGSGNLDHIQIIKKPGGSLRDSYLADGAPALGMRRTPPPTPIRGGYIAFGKIYFFLPS